MHAVKNAGPIVRQIKYLEIDQISYHKIPKECWINLNLHQEIVHNERIVV